MRPKCGSQQNAFKIKFIYYIGDSIRWNWSKVEFSCSWTKEGYGGIISFDNKSSLTIVYTNSKACSFLEFIIKNLELWETTARSFVLLNGRSDNGAVYFAKAFILSLEGVRENIGLEQQKFRLWNVYLFQFTSEHLNGLL